MNTSENSQLRSNIWSSRDGSVSQFLLGLARGTCACLLALCAALLTCACSSLPAHVNRPVSRADVDTHHTALVRAANASLVDAAAFFSGFRLLASGEHAFDARIALIRNAQRTLDVQYYLIASDSTGFRFLDELRAAAGRGVRVRLLVDDLFSASQDAVFANLAAQHNVEVRMFNPLPSRSPNLTARVLLSLHEYSRINSRMHNKLLVADNAFAVTGGRNISDEYFVQQGPAHFIDMDVLCAGPVVNEFSQAFDRHWNSDAAYPIQELGIRVANAEGARERLHPLVPRERADAQGQQASQPLAGLESELADGFVRLKFASARVIADLPGKPPGPGAQRTVAGEHLQLVRSARSEVLIASPYVIPGPDASEAIREGTSRGVRMVIMTNSLTTTDEPLVHFAYARHRRSLLKMGVTLTELKPMAAQPGGIARPGESRGSLARLHAKVSIVDQRWLFMGSMNMDGRSAHWNTELNLLIDSPALAAEATSLLMNEQLPNRYQLRVIDHSDQIEWNGSEEGPQMVHHHEPNARWAQYLRLTLLSVFVSEDLL